MTFANDTSIGVTDYQRRRKRLICDRAAGCTAPTCPHKKEHDWFIDCERSICQRDQTVTPVMCVPERSQCE